MTKYVLSALERWNRNFVIEAKSPEQALEKYREYTLTGSEDNIEYSYDPEYLDDTGDIEIYTQDGKFCMRVLK